MSRIPVRLLSATLALLLLIGCGGDTGDRPAGALAVERIEPKQVGNDRDSFLIVVGNGFHEGMTATIGTTALQQVTYVNELLLTAVVPRGVAPGSYPISVRALDGNTAASTEMVTVVDSRRTPTPAATPMRTATPAPTATPTPTPTPPPPTPTPTPTPPPTPAPTATTTPTPPLQPTATTTPTQMPATPLRQPTATATPPPQPTQQPTATEQPTRTSTVPQAPPGSGVRPDVPQPPNPRARPRLPQSNEPPGAGVQQPSRDR